MSLFFDNKLPVSPLAGNRIYVGLEWHKIHPLLAIAVFDDKKGGLVSIYDNNKDECVDVESSPRADTPVSSTCWHPTQAFLAIAYESGEVITWNQDEGETFEGVKSHHHPVTLLEWSSTGSILVSADTYGNLVVWSGNAQGHLVVKAHHDFKDPVCQLVFRGSSRKDLMDSTKKSLESMTTWRPKTAGMRKERERSVLKTSGGFGNDTDKYEECFFVGLLSGAIFYVQESGSSEEVLMSGSSVKSLLFHPPKDMLVVMTDAAVLGQFRVDSNGGLSEIHKIKLSGHGDIRIFWVGTGTFAILTNELSLRLWNIDVGDNCVVEPKGNNFAIDEYICSVDFQNQTGTLCCVTNKGQLVKWKRRIDPTFGIGAKVNSGSGGTGGEDAWEWYGISSVSPATRFAVWCQNVPGVLAVNAASDIYILREQPLIATYKDQVGIIQVQPTQLTIEMFEHNLTFDLTTTIQVRGLANTSSMISVWNGTEIETYEIGPNFPSNHNLLGSFPKKCDMACMFEQSLFIVESDHIHVCNFQGTLKHTLQFLGGEGAPITLFGSGEYMTTGTANGWVKVWHVAQREPKGHLQPKNLKGFIPDFGEIIQAKNNFEGSRVVFTIALGNSIPHSGFYIWELSGDRVFPILVPELFVWELYWDAEESNYLGVHLKCVPPELKELEKEGIDLSEAEKSLKGQGQEVQGPTELKDKDSGKSETRVQSSTESLSEKSHRGSLSLFGENYDDDDLMDAPEPEPQTLELKTRNQELTLTLFISGVNGIVIHENLVKRPGDESLLGLDIPHLIHLRNPNKIHEVKVQTDQKENEEEKKHEEKEHQLNVHREVISDFYGMETEEKKSIFSYVCHSAFDDSTQALRALYKIQSKNPVIWKNIAKTCVKTKKLDVAALCLARLRNVTAARAVRKSKAEPEHDAAVAMLAIQLNMLKEAEELYKGCGRYDLLLRLLRCSQRWEEAIQLCENHLRIQLKTICHSYAKFLETNKKIDEAILMYERSETHRYEVPRMLVDYPQKLEAYIVEKKDKELYQWYAQFLESGSEVEPALKYYELAEDWLSLVRLLAFHGQLDKAISVAERTNDKVASYQLGRIMEEKGDTESAIHFYSISGAHASGIRLCKETQSEERLWALAQLAGPKEQTDAARYFETSENPDYDKAIILYHKSGYGAKAIELAFLTQQFSALHEVAKELISKEGQKTDPELLKKCAEFFVENKQYDMALDMFAACHKYVEAMEMCVQYELTITEELAEKLSAPKGAGLDERTRLELLEKMGECCMLQGSYHLAAKKFTQANNKIQAMRSLLKSGDTERIIFYANLSRQPDIFIMAANYLQTLLVGSSFGPMSRSQLMDTITQFYTKAKAPESLVTFYEAAASSLVDETRDYEGCRVLLDRAMDVMKEGGGQYSFESRKGTVQAKLQYVKTFLGLKELRASNPLDAARQLKLLLKDPNLDLGVRRGDVYGEMIECYLVLDDIERVLEVIEEMRSSLQLSPSKFLSPGSLEILDKKLGRITFRVKSSSPAHSQGFKPYPSNQVFKPGGQGRAQESSDQDEEEEEEDEVLEVDEEEEESEEILEDEEEE